MLPIKESPNGIEFLSKENDPYKPHIGNCVEVFSGGGMSQCGIYRGLTKDYDVVLQPCITSQSGITKDSRVMFWENRPTFVTKSSLASIMPIDYIYINRRVLESKKNIISY